MLWLSQLYFKTHYKKGALLRTQAEFPKGSSMKDLLNVILLIKTALLHRPKVGVRLRDYYRTYTEFFKRST